VSSKEVEKLEGCKRRQPKKQQAERDGDLEPEELSQEINLPNWTPSEYLQ
jgi:hypothetical protein